MSKLLITFFLLISLSINKGQAQMAPAAAVSWDIDQNVVLPVSRDSVWALFKDYSKVSSLSNGFVKSIVHKDNIMPILREVTFKGGSKREELLAQLEEQHRFFVINIKESSLPVGVKLVRIAVFITELDDNSCKVNWKVLVEGKKEAEINSLEAIKKEISQYEIGFKAYFNGDKKVIKAVKME